LDSGSQEAGLVGYKKNIHTMKINKHTNVKVSLKIKKRIWNKIDVKTTGRVNRCTRSKAKIWQISRDNWKTVRDTT